MLTSSLLTVISFVVRVKSIENRKRSREKLNDLNLVIKTKEVGKLKSFARVYAKLCIKSFHLVSVVCVVPEEPDEMAHPREPPKE